MTDLKARKERWAELLDLAAQIGSGCDPFVLGRMVRNAAKLIRLYEAEAEASTENPTVEERNRWEAAIAARKAAWAEILGGEDGE